MKLIQIKRVVKTVFGFALLGATFAAVFASADFLGHIFWTSRTDRFLSQYLALPEIKSALFCLTLRLVKNVVVVGGVVGIVTGVLLLFTPKPRLPVHDAGNRPANAK